MGVARPAFALTSLVLIAGAIVLIFLILLAGAVTRNPVDQFYFLQADTSSIPNAPAISRWTLWNVCGVDANGLDVCSGVKPAFPLDPVRNFQTTTNVPGAFVGTNHFYYLTRFMFAFWLIALFFAVISLFLGVFALCSRIGSYLSSVMCFIALFFQTLTASLMTAAYVQGRDAFQSNNQNAALGRDAFGFVWAAWACLLISGVLFCVGGTSSSRSQSRYRKSRSFGRKRSVRSRGSFIDTDRRNVLDV